MMIEIEIDIDIEEVILTREEGIENRDLNLLMNAITVGGLDIGLTNVICQKIRSKLYIIY